MKSKKKHIDLCDTCTSKRCQDDHVIVLRCKDYKEKVNKK